MFIETVPNRTSPPAVLLRESYRDEQGRAQKRTLANLSKLPDDVVDGLQALLKGGTVIGSGPDECRSSARCRLVTSWRRLACCARSRWTG